MSRTTIRGILRGAGLLLGLLLPAGTATAQALPDPLPPPPPAPGPVAESVAPRVIATSPVVRVPAAGPAPTRVSVPLDPIALQRHAPKHVEEKTRSWHWRRLQGKFWGYPEEYPPRPLGAALYDHNRTMVANGAAARLVLYRYDFIEGSSRLNPRGVEQLTKAAVQLAASPYPLLIEHDPDRPELAQERRLAVLAALAAGPIPVPPDRVLVGGPIAHGMSGIEAHIIGDNALSRANEFGPPIQLEGGGVSGLGGVTSSR